MFLKITRKLLCAIVLTVFRFGLVEANLENVAFKKPTKQVDSFPHTDRSELGNDEITGQNFHVGDCTHTRTGSNTWWMVDLIHSYDVNTIHILNRFSDIDRLSQFDIYVSTERPISISAADLPGQLCLTHPETVSPNGYQILHCTQTVKGRYVYIWKKADNGPLTICDFKVMVDLTSRHMDCNITQGLKVSATPAYSEILAEVSFQNCLFTCASNHARDASILQIYWPQGRCDCIQVSEFTGEDYAEKNDNDFDMCYLIETNTAN